jgi:hypothetical protein
MINRICKHLRRKIDPVDVLDRLSAPELRLTTLNHVGEYLVPELQLRQGMTKTLANSNAPICELATIPAYDGSLLFDVLGDLISGRGFIPMTTRRLHMVISLIRQTTIA